MKSIVAFLLILTLVIPASARERTPLEQAKRIAVGSRIQVETKNRRVESGHLLEVTQTGLAIEPYSPGKGSRKEFLFQDILQIRSLEPTTKDIVLKPLHVLALIPVALVCGIGWIFNRKTCDDL